MSPRILSCISRFFDVVLPDQRKDFHTVFATKKCIPTDDGSMMKPTEVGKGERGEKWERAILSCLAFFQCNSTRSKRRFLQPKHR
jgi:hypothetical protein